jgi:rubrerythrin
MTLDIDFSKLDAQDVLDLAILVEQEAEDNYEQLASWMEADGKSEVAAFFAKMAKLEERHRAQITEQRQQLFGDAPARHSSRAVFEVEQPDYDDIGADITLEGAFELAMNAERKAGDYYGSALDYASDPQVIALFENLKKAEQDHMRLLQEQKDRAFADRQ